MKPLLTILSVLAFTTITGNLNNTWHTTLQKNNISSNSIATKMQQNTIYIDENDKQQTTSEHNLSKIKSSKIIQIGFYKNENNEVQAVRMPKTVKMVPDQLPAAITSLKNVYRCYIFQSRPFKLRYI